MNRPRPTLTGAGLGSPALHPSRQAGRRRRLEPVSLRGYHPTHGHPREIQRELATAATKPGLTRVGLFEFR